jgi:hypothetical protein
VLTLPTLQVWRCRPGCGRIRMRLAYDGSMPIEHICSCNSKRTLPEDRDNLRLERRL